MSERVKSLAIIAVVAAGSSLMLWIFSGFLKASTNFDGPYYAVVAQCGYDKVCIGNSFSFPLPLEYYAAHFPLYPLLIRVTSLVGGFSLLYSSLLITTFTGIAYGWILYLVWKKSGWKYALFTALVALFAWPRMWVVRSVGSPEALFLGLIVLALHFFEKKKFLWAGLFGALATLTKSPGILVFFGFLLSLVDQYITKKRFQLSSLWILLIPLALVGLFGYYFASTGDVLAYFHSGDNIHLQLFPFRVFDSSQPWVGTFWLEDILWVYLIGGLGVALAMKKNRTWGWFGLVFFATILFVSHRDISRYSLPLVPVVLLGFSDIFARKEVRIALVLLLVPMFFYSINFLEHNALGIADLSQFFLK